MLRLNAWLSQQRFIDCKGCWTIDCKGCRYLLTCGSRSSRRCQVCEFTLENCSGAMICWIRSIVSGDIHLWRCLQETWRLTWKHLARACLWTTSKESFTGFCSWAEDTFFIRYEGGDLFNQHPCSSVGLDVCLFEECTLEVHMQSLVFTRGSPSMSWNPS